MMKKVRSPLCDSHGEELASTITHGVATLLSVWGLVAMVRASDGDALKVVSACLFGTTLILLYASSTLYHLVTTPRAKALFQTFDHLSIYLLIAGSYTPLTLVGLGGAWGWSIFGVVWGCAIGGVLLKTLGRGKKDSRLSTALYLIMGWIIIIAIKELISSIPTGGLVWIVSGGVTYSLGVLFYAWQKLPYNHAIWHLFVMAGSICHVIAFVYYVF